jgi:hypothetical protein
MSSSDGSTGSSTVGAIAEAFRFVAMMDGIVPVVQRMCEIEQFVIVLRRKKVEQSSAG